MKDQIELQVEELEERIAPSANGQLGYEGQPGNQGRTSPPLKPRLVSVAKSESSTNAGV